MKAVITEPTWLLYILELQQNYMYDI